MNKLFSEIKLRNASQTLTNALAVAPMTTSQSNPDGTVSEAEAAWLERLAADDYGMVITCASAISKQSIAFHNQLSVGDDSKLPGLTQLAQRLKGYKAKTIIQLCHGGSRAIPELTGSPAYSASSYFMPQIPGFVSPLALSITQIKDIINDFATACERVAKAGFDGIEFHGANGYLFTQFISTMTNLRDDEYGGNLVNRARFSREVVRACRSRVPADFILGFRISFESMGMETGLDMDENIQISNWLADDGIDYLHVSHLQYDSPSIKYPDQIALQYISTRIDKDLPLVCAGGITTVEDANKALEYGADIVAIGRAAIGNVNLPGYFAQNEELPFTMPYSENHLREIGIGEDFLNYFRLPFIKANLKIMKE